MMDVEAVLELAMELGYQIQVAGEKSTAWRNR